MSRLRKLCNKNYKFNKILLRIFISYFWQTKTIRDISLCSNYGEYFGFLKANGAGKTIIFKFLSKEILSTYDNYISIIKKFINRILSAIWCNFWIINSIRKFRILWFNKKCKRK